MANQRGGWATSQRILFVVAAVAAATVLSCGGSDPPPAGAETRSVVAPLTSATDTTNAGRASFYAAEVARYRDIANRERQVSAAYATRTPPAATAKDWNATLKVSADARAVAADQIATRIQTFADYHAAEAAKEVAR